MTRKVGEVMTSRPRSLPLDATLYDAAQIMRDEGIGDVLVTYAGRLCGMVTDRDIVVRAVAERRDTSVTPLGDVCTADLTTIRAGDDTAEALRLMREQAVRRLPVVDDAQRPVGIVTLSDLAEAGDGLLAPLADIRRAPPSL
ncbi:CBS domain-containing protein [Actinomadura rayongensis]|uniref:CBS domain-containing protein n=1 Tax=Actinomadura rayongensis TaxID=1429076 RepID=UPI001926B7D1|nr:CBS domain-containing protein [Actinomadura rayongensis]